MSMIRIKDLSFSYPGNGTPVFERVSFQIDTDWKLGLIGRNGRGKTTFLRLLCGAYPYQGTIETSVSFDYFPYEINGTERETKNILLEIAPRAETWEFVRELSSLSVEETVLYRPFASLSNGERTKVLLAALFLQEGHFLLLDEPTNHLDLEARRIVAAYLRRKKRFILVSHDRCFLDACIDHVLSINRCTIEVQAGTFSSYIRNFERQQALEAAQNEQLQRDIKRLKKAAGRTAAWADRVEASKFGQGSVDRGYIGHKAEKMMRRAKALENRQEQAIEEKKGLLRNVETMERLKLSVLYHHAKQLVSFDLVTVYYGRKRACGPVSFTLNQGQRIALDGKNGSGKSSLLKLLIQSIVGSGEAAGTEVQTADLRHEGRLLAASGLQISYVPQDTSFLHGSLTAFAGQRGINGSLFLAILRKLGFERSQFEKAMEAFSSGQKKKVLLAASLSKPAHVYVWDEPLNFIDIYSRLQIEALLLEFKPSMIFVEHDEAFREKIATEILRIDRCSCEER